jgi:hypothetical protein
VRNGNESVPACMLKPLNEKLSIVASFVGRHEAVNDELEQTNRRSWEQPIAHRSNMPPQ